VTDTTRPGAGTGAKSSRAADAAELERLRARLAEAEQRFRDLLEGSLQGVMVHRDNRLLFVNPAFAEIFGYPDAAAALAVQDWQRFQAPHETERMEGYRRARLRGEPAPPRYVFEGRRRDGSPVWVENVARVIAWESQPAILSTMLDVTEHRRMEEALRLSEERFRIAFENAPLGVSVAVPGQGYVQVNDTFCVFLGRPREALLNHPDPLLLLREVTHPDDLATDLAQFGRLMDGTIDAYQLEKRYLRPNGEVRWGQLAVSAARDSKGGVRYIISHIADITERKQAETALRESEERFRVAFEHSPVGIALGTPEGGWRQMNRAWAEFLGQAVDDPVFQMRLDEQLKVHSAPEDYAEHLRLHNELVSGVRESFQLEKRYQDQQGRVRWGSLHVAAIRNPDGTVKWLISQRLDITAQKEAEMALRESEERFRIAFDHAPVGMALGTPERGWFAVNQARADFWGLALEELMGSYEQYQAAVRRVSHPEDYAADMAQWRRVLAGEIDAYEMEKRYIRPDGQVRWGHLSVAVSRKPDRSIQYIISHIVDVTARLRAESALRLSEERFRVAFEHAPVGMNLINADGRYIQVNRAFEEFTGISRNVMLGLPGGYEDGILAVSHPDDVEATRAGFRKIFSGELHAFQIEKRFLRPDGELRWGHAHLAPVRSADGTLEYVITQVVDVTPRKRAEEALRESEERFRISFENAPIGIALGVAGRGWVQVNPALVAFLGRTAEELQSNPDPIRLIKSFTHPDDVEQSLAHLRRLASGEVSSYIHEKRYVRPDGEIRWGLHSAAGSRDAAGRLHYTVSLISDVTELRQAQQALRESEERFRVAFEYAPQAVSVAVPERGLVQMNPAMERFLGRPREVLMGRPDMLALLQEISHPEDYEHNAALFRRLAAGEIDHYQMEKRYLLPGGEIRWGFLSVAASHGPEGTPRYIVTQITDITALKQAEQALREREAALAAAQRITHLGSWELTDIDLEHLERSRLRWSDEMFRIYGLDPGSAEPNLETVISRIVPEDRERVRDLALHCLKEQVPFAAELRIERPDGSQRTVLARGEAERGGSAGRTAKLRGTMQDITEQKELERKLLQAQKLESLGLLAGGIAHDFNNLLTGILGYASLVRQHLAASSPLQDYVTQIETGGRRAAELCQQMLAYAGRGRFEVRAHALNDIVRDTLPLLEVSIPKKVTLALRLAEGLPAVEVDATQIRQIVMNLVTNAADAIGNKEGRIAVTTGTVAADRAYLAQTYLAPDLPEGCYVFLDVSDTGAGMTPEVQKRIFDPFFTTKFAGRGLGLAAVLGIVRAHHGALKVYSEPGKGTTMRLLLPAARRAAEPAEPRPAIPWRGQGLALVVDDEPAVRDVAARLLQELGFDTLPARDGAEAVEIYRREAGRVRLVLLDLTMPLMDGEETFRALRTVNPAATVVLMSGFTQQESMERFAGMGLAAFLQKPFSLEVLRETLRQVFADRGPAPVSNRVT
jgi:PAS domain S-box-containing protein